MIIAGCDLGLKNFAISVIKSNNSYQKILFSGMVGSLVTNLKHNILQQRLKFFREIYTILQKYKPKKLVVERFMIRGKFGGIIGECLNIMLGILIEICCRLKIEFRAITSAEWKNAFQRSLQKKLLSLYKFLKPLPPHMIDSVLQATYEINPKYKKWSVNYLLKLKRKYEKTIYS